MTDLSGTFAIERLQHEETGEHFARLSFDKIGGGRDFVTVPVSILDDPSTLLSKLRNAGAPIVADQRKDLAEFGRSLPNDVCRMLVTSGWKLIGDEPVFAVADRLIGSSNVKCYVHPRRTTYAGSSAGTLKDWRQGPAKLALQSDTAVVALMVAFGAILQHFGRLTEGALFNLAGPSSTGKSSALIAAASIFGGGKLSGWDMTDQARIELAAASNDIAAIFDDPDRDTKGTPETRLRKLLDVTDPLTAGEGRQRSTIVQEQLPDLRFNFFGLSSSQESVESFTRDRGIKRSNGNRVRLLEYSTPRAVGGIWGAATEALGTDGATLSNRLRDLCEGAHGTAGPAFVEYLIEHYDHIRGEVARLSNKFIAELPPGLNDWEGRIASKCALLYTAGKLASRAKVLPIARGETLRISRGAYLNIVQTAFGQPEEVRTAAAAFRSQLADRQQFPRVNSIDEIQADEGWTGFFVKAEGRLYVRSSAFDTLAIAGLRQNELKAAGSFLLSKLTEKGAKLPGHGEKTTQNKRVGAGRRDMRLLAFDKTVLVAALKTLANQRSA